MFSGIVEGMGRVKSVERGNAYMEMAVDVGGLSAGVRIGDSISANGTCLTVEGK